MRQTAPGQARVQSGTASTGHAEAMAAGVSLESREAGRAAHLSHKHGARAAQRDPRRLEVAHQACAGEARASAVWQVHGASKAAGMASTGQGAVRAMTSRDSGLTRREVCPTQDPQQRHRTLLHGSCCSRGASSLNAALLQAAPQAAEVAESIAEQMAGAR